MQESCLDRSFSVGEIRFIPKLYWHSVIKFTRFCRGLQVQAQRYFGRVMFLKVFFGMVKKAMCTLLLIF
jgi:hypothetical protein